MPSQVHHFFKTVSSAFQSIHIYTRHRRRNKSGHAGDEMISSTQSGKNTNIQKCIWNPQSETCVHRGHECGFSNYGFFKLYKAFAFGLFESTDHQGFGSLRILNHAWLTSEGVVPPHEHASFYIVAIPLSGEANMRVKFGDKTYKHTVSPGQIEWTYCGDGIERSFLVEPGKPPLNAVEFWLQPSTHNGVPAVHLTEATDVFTQPNKFRPIVAPAPSFLRRDSDQTVVEPRHSSDKYTGEHGTLRLYGGTRRTPGVAKDSDKLQAARVLQVDSDTHVCAARLTPGARVAYRTAQMVVECRSRQCGMGKQRSAGWLSFLSNDSGSLRSARSVTETPGEDRTKRAGVKGATLPNRRLVYIAVINSLDEFGDAAKDIGRIVIPGQLELSYGDGAYLSNVPCGAKLEIFNRGKDPANILIFDMDSNSALE